MLKAIVLVLDQLPELMYFNLDVKSITIGKGDKEYFKYLPAVYLHYYIR